MSGDSKPALLITAAGQGRRVGGGKNKLYMFLRGKPVLARTLDVFKEMDLFASTIVIVAPGEEKVFRRWVEIPFLSGDKRFTIVAGGQERQDSVYNGLLALKEKGMGEGSIVCIHDGARPLVSSSLVDKVYREALLSGAAVAGIPLKDTIKIVNRELTVVETPPREDLFAVQTPQCFEFSLLWEAHLRAREDNYRGSDDASLVERLGVPVKIVPGTDENLKLTTEMDFKVAEALLDNGKNPEQSADDTLDNFFDWTCR